MLVMRKWIKEIKYELIELLSILNWKDYTQESLLF